jgi:hypothetical protein
LRAAITPCAPRLLFARAITPCARDYSLRARLLLARAITPCARDYSLRAAIALCAPRLLLAIAELLAS